MYSALGLPTFCQTVNIGTKGPRLAEEESSANRRSACPCVNFSLRRAILCIFWSYTAKFKLQVIQDVYKGQQKYVFTVVFCRQPKICRYELSYNCFQMCLWCDCWLFKIATQSNFHLRVLNVKNWIWQHKFHPKVKLCLGHVVHVPIDI